MSTTASNTIISLVYDKISNVSGFVKKHIVMLKYQTLKENISLLLKN